MAVNLFGSDEWRGLEILEDDKDSPKSAKIRRCINDTHWDILVARCSELRGGISCTIGGNFSCGTQNLVKLVKFEDDVKWVVRVALEDDDDWLASSLEDRMRSQVATYQFLKKHTNIPVPEVYGFRALRTDEIGPPYMLLDYLHGTTADKCDLNAEQVLHVLEQMADITVALATHKFDKIGSLYTNENGDFEIGQDLEIGGGPYQHAREYYNAVSKHRFQFFANHYFRTNSDAMREEGLHLPSLFNQMMDILTDCATDHGPFSLTNTDFGFHNVLVDETFKIVGVIDCDTVKAAPIHVVAQYPVFSEIVLGVPGLVTTKPMAIKVLAEGAVMFKKYVDMVMKAEMCIVGETPIATAMVSDGARLFEGLEHYQGHQDWVNVEWIQGYWYMYYRALRGPSGAMEFGDANRSKEENEIPEEDAECPEDGLEEQTEEEGGESTNHGDKQNDAEHAKPKPSGA